METQDLGWALGVLAIFVGAIVALGFGVFLVIEAVPFLGVIFFIAAFGPSSRDTGNPRERSKPPGSPRRCDDMGVKT
jgi:hypothetical protein